MVAVNSGWFSALRVTRQTSQNQTNRIFGSFKREWKNRSMWIKSSDWIFYFSYGGVTRFRAGRRCSCSDNVGQRSMLTSSNNEADRCCLSWAPSSVDVESESTADPETVDVDDDDDLDDGDDERDSGSSSSSLPSQFWFPATLTPAWLRCIEHKGSSKSGSEVAYTLKVNWGFAHNGEKSEAAVTSSARESQLRVKVK